jgi:hypothetical protein
VTADLAAAEAAYHAQLAREIYRDGFEDGRRAGIADTVAWYKRLLRNTFADAQLEQRRRHVACRYHRRRGCSDNCACKRCEDRGRETYGNPHPDDYPGQDGAA